MATGREGEARDAVRDAAPATTTTRDGEATTRWIGRGETREEGGERGKGATATRRARDARDLERRLGFLVSLWMACVSRVTPQIALAGVVGAGAQWLKLSACDETQRYSTTCRYAFTIEAHYAVSAVLSFLLVFRAVQAFRRFEDGKFAMIDVKDALRNLASVTDVEAREPASGSIASMFSSKDHHTPTTIEELQSEIRRLCNLTFAFMRQALRESRFGVVDAGVRGGKRDVSTESLLHRDDDGTPNVSNLTKRDERTEYAKLAVENRPDAVMIDALTRIETMHRAGVLSERAAMEAFRESQRALDAYRQAMLIIETPTPKQYSHTVTVLLFAFIFSAPFALSSLMDWRTPLVSATLAWLFYGVNEIASTLEDPFKWVLPAHPLNVIARRIEREMDAFKMSKDVVGIDVDDEPLSVDSMNYRRWRNPFWFVIDCFAWEKTTLPHIGRQIGLAAVVGIGAQLLKILVCGWNVTDSSQCLVTFDLSAHRILAMPISLLLVINTDWGYERFISSKKLVVSMQNSLRSLTACSAIFTTAKNDDLSAVEADAREVQRLSNVMYGFARIAVRELISRDPSGNTVKLDDILTMDKFGGACKLCDLVRESEHPELKSLPVHAFPTWVGMRLNAIFEEYGRSGAMTERFSAEAYRKVCNSLQAMQGLMRVVSTPVPNRFRHLLQVLLFFYVFTMPFVLSVSYQWITSVPVILVALAFYGIAETSTSMMEPFSWTGPRHDLSGMGSRMFTRHERLGAFAMKMRGSDDTWVKLMDEAKILGDHLSTAGGLYRESLGANRSKKSLLAAPSIRVKNISNYEKEFKTGAIKNMQALRTGWSFVSCVFHVRNTVVPQIALQIALTGAVSVLANFLKIHWCGSSVSNVTQCSFTFDDKAHVMSGSIIGFTLVFRLMFSYSRYYDGKGLVGVMVNSLRCLNLGACTMMRSLNRRSSPELEQEINDDVTEIRRLSCVLMAFMRQAVRERRHGVEPFTLKKLSPTDEEMIDDPQGWPSLSVMLTDAEKARYLKCDYRARVGCCASKMIAIIDERRRLGHISERSAFEMLGRIEACVNAVADIERIVSSSMPFAFIHLMNFVVFFFALSSPFVFITSYKWLAVVPSMLVTLSLFGIAELGSLLADPFGWEDPKHDLTKVGWALYTETIAIHEKCARAVGDAEETTHSGVDALVLSGAAAPKALRDLTVWEAVRRQRGVDSTSSYFSYLFRLRNTVFPHIWPMMFVMMFIGVGAQFYKLEFCGDDVTDHRMCDVVFAPAAVSIIGRMTMFAVVYRFFFAFRVFYEAKTGIYDLLYSLYTLNIQACAHLRELSRAGKPIKDNSAKAVRKARYAVLRLSCALFASMRQSLNKDLAHGETKTKLSDAHTLFYDEDAESLLGALLDEEGKNSFLKLFDASSEERVATIAARLLAEVETARSSGCITNRGAAMMANSMQTALHAFSRCTRARNTRAPYSLKHLINIVLFLWMFATASVIVVAFTYMTWLPLGILALTLYGMIDIAGLLEEPFTRDVMCSNDLIVMGQSLWKSCAHTHESLAESDELKAEISLLVKRVEEKRLDVGKECYEEVRQKVDQTAVAPAWTYDREMPAGWTFPKQRSFRSGKFGIFTEFVSLRGTLILPTLPFIFAACAAAMGLYFLSEAVCDKDELYTTGQCKTLITPEGHTIAVPVLGFCIAHLLNLTYTRYYTAREYLDNLIDYGRDLVIELNTAFQSSETDEDCAAHAKMLSMLNSLMAFARQSIRESRVGYPSTFRPKEELTPNTVLDDDFFGAPSTKDLMNAEQRNAYAGIAPAFRVSKCSGELKRAMRSLPKSQVNNEQRLYRIYHDIDCILDAWTNCETIVSTPIPPFYMYSVYLLCYVFVLTSPLAFIHSYGVAVAVPVGLLTFVVCGIVRVSTEMMNPFKWSASSHEINEVSMKVYRLTRVFPAAAPSRG